MSTQSKRLIAKFSITSSFIITVVALKLYMLLVQTQFVVNM